MTLRLQLYSTLLINLSNAGNMLAVQVPDKSLNSEIAFVQKRNNNRLVED